MECLPPQGEFLRVRLRVRQRFVFAEPGYSSSRLPETILNKFIQVAAK